MNSELFSLNLKLAYTLNDLLFTDIVTGHNTNETVLTVYHQHHTHMRLTHNRLYFRRWSSSINNVW